MRSSVSVILSNPPPDIKMSYPDYSAHPHQHHSLLILIKQVGSQLHNRHFHKLYDRISRVSHVKVTDSVGGARPVWVSYKKDYPVESNDWGDFQAHRRVLGIISIGRVDRQAELNEVCKQHESLKVKYSSTIFDSRCIILGLNPDGSVYEEPPPPAAPPAVPLPHPISKASTLQSDEEASGSHQVVEDDQIITTPTSSTFVDRDSGVYVTPPATATATEGSCNESQRRRVGNGNAAALVAAVSSRRSSSDSGSECATSESAPVEDEEGSSLNGPGGGTPTTPPSVSSSSSSSSSSSLQPPTCFKTRALFYPTADHAVNIEAQIQEFICSLFWVLEYKRTDKSQEKLLPDRPQHLLCAPFERKDLIGLDLDSRTNKKKCVGRIKKHLGDLSLQVGLPNEALALYSQAVDILKGCNDWLWLASCYEGLCSASVTMLYPDLCRNNNNNTVMQRNSSLGGGAASSSSRRRGGGSGGNISSSNSNSLPLGLDPSTLKQQQQQQLLSTKYCLSSDDVIEKYKEAIVHYSKYRNAGVIETEASLKAVHVLIEARRFLLAAEFLSNVVFINLQLSDEEKIIRFNALSDMYNQIGFHRKASFFRRVAAMRCVAPQNQEPDWSRCYRLLLLTLDGYRLSLDAALFVKEGRPGWPALQIQILQELVGTSRRMGEHGLCTRHQAFLLSAMLPHLNSHDRTDAFTMLEAVSAKCPGGAAGASGLAGAPLVVPESSAIIPPVNFTNIPFCRYVKVMPLPKDKQVQLKLGGLEGGDSEGAGGGPFIFSPFQSIVTTTRVAGKIDCDWVEGDVCEVALTLCNPLPFQIKLSHMKLLTEGAEFEPWMSTIVLDAHPEPQVVSLRGRPQEPGELRILGYSFVLSGVSSFCRFKSLTHLRVPFYFLSVVPSLPCVQIFCDASSSGTGLVSDGALEGGSKVCVSLNAGETHECSIIIHNVSSQPVEKVEVGLEGSSSTTSRAGDKIFDFSLDNLEAQLPIGPGGRASLTLYIYAASEFLLPGYSLQHEDEVDYEMDAEGGGGVEGSGGGGVALALGSENSASLMGPPSSFSSSSRHSTIMSSLRGRHKAKRALSSASSSISMSSFRSGSSGSSTSTATPTMSSMNVSTGGNPPHFSNSSCCRHHLSGSVKLSYTGGRGMESKYWRVCEVAVDVEVIPSLLVTRWDALPAERPNQCYLVLDLLNASSHEMDLQYTTNKRILVQGGESCRVPVPIDRCPIAKLMMKDEERRRPHGGLEGGGEEGNRKDLAEEEDDDRRSEILGDHVASSIELRWTIGGDSPGRASLRSLTFPPQIRHLIAMAPINWEIKLNDQGIDNGVENVGVTGELQRLEVGVSNATADVLPPLVVVVSSFQDHQNGTQSFRLDAKMASTGATKFIIPQLGPEEAFYHECGLIFFSSGIFKVEVSGSPFNACFSQQLHFQPWKLAPPIEISILGA